MFNKNIVPLAPFIRVARAGLSSEPDTASTLGSPGFGGAPEGADRYEFVGPVAGPGYVYTDGNGNQRWAPVNTCVTPFNLLPATSATAGNDEYSLTFGTATVQVTRATKGGVNMKTKASAAQNDIAALKPMVSSGMITPIRAAALARASTRVNLTQITGTAAGGLVFGFGLNENVTDPDPTATAGDGMTILFDPSNQMSTHTGLAAGSLPNWILHQKIAGANVFSDTGIPVNAGLEYDLMVWFDASLIPHFAINGQEIAWGSGLGASNSSAPLAPNTGVNPVNVVVGIKLVGSAPAVSDFDCRFIQLERNIG